LVFDGSNLGVGVTPSAWSGTTALQVGSVGGAISSSSTQINLSYNFVGTATGNKYITNGFSSIYQQNAGAHAWYTAPSGTAGNAITFTQAMTLDASGNLVVGGTSATNTAANRGNISINGTSSAILSLSTGNTAKGYLYTQGTDIILNATAGTLALQANGNGATIDTSGNLLVVSSIFGNGCTTTTANLPSNAGVNSINNGSTVAFNFGIPTTTTNSNLGNFFNGNGSVGSITVNGSATSYNTSSDYRLKNITGPLTGAKDFIMALKPKQGTWKVDGSAFVGFLAHEFQEVSPSSVSGEKDAVDVDGKPIMQAMQASSSEVMANLVAFIQEQQALITQLTARITALESA